MRPRSPLSARFSSTKVLFSAVLAIGLLVTTGRPTDAAILVWSTGNGQPSTESLAAQLQAAGGFDSVVGIDTNNLSLADLLAYDKVLFFTNGLGDPTNGNVLADYADTGRGLVLGTFSWANQGSNTLAGRIITDGISPFVAVGSTIYTNLALGTTDGSALFNGVNTFESYFHDDVELVASAVLNASYANGLPLVATNGNVIGVNAFPMSGYTGDGLALFANALGAAGVSDVPEPSAFFMLSVGLCGIAVAVKKRRGR